MRSREPYPVRSHRVSIYIGKKSKICRYTVDFYKTQAGRIGYVRQVDIDETRYPELIINLAKNTDFLSRADVIQLLHVSPSKAYTLLKKLVAQGVLEPVNKGHYAKYRYVGNR